MCNFYTNLRVKNKKNIFWKNPGYNKIKEYFLKEKN